MEYEHVLQLPVEQLPLAADGAFRFVDITDTPFGRPPGFQDGKNRVGVAQTLMTNAAWDEVLMSLAGILEGFKGDEEVTIENLRELAIAEFGADNGSPNKANHVEQVAYELLWMCSLISQKNEPANPDEGWFAKPNLPKVNVSWFDTIIFLNMCSRLLRRSGERPNAEPYYEINMSAIFDEDSSTWNFNIERAEANDTYRSSREGSGKEFLFLPMVALWEFACRAGTKEDHYGEAIGQPATAIAWFKPNAHGQLQPVGALIPNAFGLFDMLGNAWEWTGQKASS